MVGSAVCVLFVAMSFAFFEANANMQSLHLESRSVVRRRRSILNDAEKAEVVKAHNDVRRVEGASNMEQMFWNDDLATMAEAWAQKCQWYHGQAIDPPPSLGYDVVGQNLYAISGAKSINITNITLEWYNEKPFYNDDSKDCQPNKMCRHYTQVVWASTNKIGCAYVTCPTLNTTDLKNAIFFACNYAPPGNYLDQSPFNPGSQCSACASGSYWCNGGLCDGSCVSGKSGCDCYVTTCENSGTLNSDRCACECPTCYCGSDCSVICDAIDVRSLTMTAKATVALSLAILWLFIL